MNIVIISLLEKELHLSKIKTHGCSGTVYSYLLLAKGLSKLGHNITILSKTKTSEFDGVHFVKAINEYEVIKYLRITNADVFIGVSYSAKVFKNIENQQVLKIMWWHNTYTNSFDSFINLLIKKKIDYIYGVSDFQIAINGGYFIKKTLKTKINILSKIDRIPNPLYTKLFKQVNNKKTKTKNFIIGFVGNPSEDQGFHKVLENYSLFYEIHNNLELHVFGSNKLHYGNHNFNSDFKKKHIDRFIYNSKGEARKDIIFYGLLGRKDLYKEIKKCNYIIGGLQGIESFSVSLAESLGLGVPVITRLKGGQAEFVKNNKTGFVSIYKSNKMLWLFNKAYELPDNKYKKMSDNCINKINMFDYKLISKLWESKLEILLKNRRQPFYMLLLNLYRIIKVRIRIVLDIKN